MDWEFAFQLTVAISGVTFVYYTWRTKIPAVPTQKSARDVILDVIRQELQEYPRQEPVIYDLGSGWGRLCVAVAQEFPQARVIGLELAWPALIISTLRNLIAGQGNLRFRRADFWQHDISDGDIILCYLGDVVMADLRDKLRREARPNRLFISNTFPLPKDWEPLKRIPIPAMLSKAVIVYRQETLS